VSEETLPSPSLPREGRKIQKLASFARISKNLKELVRLSRLKPAYFSIYLHIKQKTPENLAYFI